MLCCRQQIKFIIESRGVTGVARAPGQAKTTKTRWHSAVFYFANQGKNMVLLVLPHMAPLQKIMNLSVEDLTVDCNIDTISFLNFVHPFFTISGCYEMYQETRSIVTKLIKNRASFVKIDLFFHIFCKNLTR